MKSYKNVPEGVDPDKFINDKFDEGVALDKRKHKVEKSITGWEEDRLKDFTECAKLFSVAYRVLLANDEFKGLLMKSSRSTRTCARRLLRSHLWDRLAKYRNSLCGRI